MENLIWLVVIGALFFFIMRKGGCCGRHSHGGHEKDSEHEHASDAKTKNGDKAGCH